MKQQYPKSNGALFKNNDKTQDNHPDYRGNIEITPEQMRNIHLMIQNNQEPKLQLAAWIRKSKNGVMYMGLEAEAYIKTQQATPQAPDYPPQQVYPPKPDVGNDDIPF